MAGVFTGAPQAPTWVLRSSTRISSTLRRGEAAPAGLRRARRSRLERVAHLLDGRTVLGAGREVRDLAGVRVVVVELAAAVGPLRVTPAGRARAAAHATGPPRDRRDRLRPSRGTRVGEKRHQAPPGEAGLGGEAGEGEERWRRVQRRDQAARGLAGARQPGSRHHERRPERVVEERVRPSEKAVAPPVGRRIADHDHRRARGGALDDGDERRQLPVRREGALEVGGRRALPGGLGPRGRSHLAPRAVGEAEVGDRDARQRGRERAGQRRGWRQARGGARLTPDRGDQQERPRLRAQPLLEARGHGLLADTPGKVEVPLGGLEGERAAGAHARDRRAPRPEERGDGTIAGAEQGGAGGARLGIGSERCLEGAPRGEKARQGRSPPRLSLAPEAVREHEHDTASRRRRGRGRDEPARRPEGEREHEWDQAAIHWPAMIDDRPVIPRDLGWTGPRNPPGLRIPRRQARMELLGMTGHGLEIQDSRPDPLLLTGPARGWRPGGLRPAGRSGRWRRSAGGCGASGGRRGSPRGRSRGRCS